NINIVRNTKYPELEHYEMIYSGPHFFVANPMYKTPREKCVLNSDYDIINHQLINEDFVARTNYTPLNVNAGYNSIIKGFEIEDGIYDDWLNYYKLGFRKMLSQAGERTLNPSILPPKSTH